RDWKSYRRFRTLPRRDRGIVFYSETHQDWHHLQPLIDFLTGPLSRTVCHVTSEPGAPLPASGTGRVHAFRIGAGSVCTWFFQMLEADVMVLTMLDLGNFQLKRSVHPVHYAYVFHSMGAPTWWTTRTRTTTTTRSSVRGRTTSPRSAGAKSFEG